MRKHLFLTMILSSLLFAGCSKGVPYNSNTGEDGARITAVALSVNELQSGELSGTTGDNEDWYYFVPPEEGEVEISILLDNPEMVISMSLTDDFGRQLQEKKCSDSVNRYQLDKLQVTKNRYFIALKTDEGVGAYSLKVDFVKPEPVVENVEVEEAPEKTTTSTTSSSCVPADKCKSGQKCCKSRTNSTTENTNTNNSNSQDNSANVKTVSGTIVLNTPRGDGLSDIKISGISKSKNIRPGMKAVLRGLNRKVDIYQCMNTSCLATVNATSEELKRYDTVDVFVE